MHATKWSKSLAFNSRLYLSVSLLLSSLVSSDSVTWSNGAFMLATTLSTWTNLRLPWANFEWFVTEWVFNGDLSSLGSEEN